jgi:hypothetical protein
MIGRPELADDLLHHVAVPGQDFAFLAPSGLPCERVELGAAQAACGA